MSWSPKIQILSKFEPKLSNGLCANFASTQQQHIDRSFSNTFLDSVDN